MRQALSCYKCLKECSRKRVSLMGTWMRTTDLIDSALEVALHTQRLKYSLFTWQKTSPILARMISYGKEYQRRLIASTISARLSVGHWLPLVTSLKNVSTKKNVDVAEGQLEPDKTWIEYSSMESWTAIASCEPLKSLSPACLAKFSDPEWCSAYVRQSVTCGHGHECTYQP